MTEGRTLTKAPGTLIAGYRVVERLGSGGMGDVYLVENQQLQRREAMKIISVGGVANPDFQQRFSNEARTMAALDHPNIITIHNYGIDDDQPWFTMSYLDGPNLADAHLTPVETVQAIGQVADALDYAHSRSVVHRDIKPANIVVIRSADGVLERAVLLDFGIAKLADSPALTAADSMIGTVAYTAPEVIGGASAGPACDQYSLACTVYELLTGRPPFTAATPTAVMMAHLQQPPPPLGAVRPDLDALTPVLMRAMAKDPAARFPDCRSFASALDAAARLTSAGRPTMLAPGHFSAPLPGPPGYPSGQPIPGQTSYPGQTPHPGQTPYAGQHPYPGQLPYPGQPPYGIAAAPSATPKRSRRPLWIAGSILLVIVLAVAGTAPLWWPSDSGPAGPTPFAAPQIAGALGSQCMIDDALLYCWGANSSGQLGVGTTETGSSPVRVPGLTSVTALSMGAYDSSSSSLEPRVTTCAVAEESLYCWGDNLFWQAGDSGTLQSKTSPFKVPGLGKVTAVATSNSSTCAVSDGDLYCWGFHTGGQLGTGTSASLKTPTRVAGLSDVTAVSSRAGSVCAIASGDLYCWGRNWNGQLGTGTTDDLKYPTKVAALSEVTAVSIGGGTLSDTPFWNTCAVAGGELYCWGNNQKKQLTADSAKSRNTPLKIGGLSSVSDVSADIGTICAVADGKASCWGNNGYGQVGDGSTTDTAVPQPVKGIDGVRQIVTAYSVTCAITENSRFCWGLNMLGRLGSPALTAKQASVPIEVTLPAA